MFSSRLAWRSPPNTISVLLERKRSQHEPILDLTESNPTRAEIVYPRDEILRAFTHPGILSYNPDSAGLLEARQQIADAFHLDTASLILTSSTSEVYSWLFKLLCDPGDEVLTPQPSYPLFDHLASLESVAVKRYSLDYHGAWSIDRASLSRSITSRTRAIVVVNPNNPTGSFVSSDEFTFLEDLCLKHGMALISDEVFAPYSFAERHATSAASSARCTAFSLNGLSKLVGMPQMKLGWIETNDPESYRRLELIADTYLSVGAPVQHALPTLLTSRSSIQRQIQSRLSSNLNLLKSQFSPRTVEGGWYAVLQVPRTISEEQYVLQLLENHNVLVQPGYFYDFASEAFLVLSLLTPLGTFREGLSRLHLFLQGC